MERDAVSVRLRVGAAQRLLLAGYSSVAHFCAQFGKGLGFDVILCEPREEVLEGVVLDGIEIRRELPSVFIANGGCHADTAVVALTHDPKIARASPRTNAVSACSALAAWGRLNWRASTRRLA
ncbi:hypothetical protein D3C79_609260 [compost metagenome]